MMKPGLPGRRVLRTSRSRGEQGDQTSRGGNTQGLEHHSSQRGLRPQQGEGTTDYVDGEALYPIRIKV